MAVDSYAVPLLQVISLGIPTKARKSVLGSPLQCSKPEAAARAASCDLTTRTSGLRRQIQRLMNGSMPSTFSCLSHGKQSWQRRWFAVVYSHAYSSLAYAEKSSSDNSAGVGIKTGNM